VPFFQGEPRVAEIREFTSLHAKPEAVSTQQMIHDKIVRWLCDEAQLPVDRIDFDQPLLELGVDSLGASTIACELEQETNKLVNPEVMIELETINEVAEYLDGLPVRQPQPAADSTPSCVRADAANAADVSEPVLPAADRFAHYERMNRRVRGLKAAGLYFFEPEISAHDGSWVVADGKRMLMLGSYEYLGLLGHPKLNQAAVDAVRDFGTGHHGARLLTGTTSVHKQLEAKLAGFMQADDAIVFSSGYVANLATISALVGRGDCVINDQWNHASIVDGCRMSGAEMLEFKHNDPDSLAEVLGKTGGRRTLVVVDAVFSMDGDIIDLPPIVDLCRKHSALLMVDEAHSLGVLGPNGRGIQEHFGMDADAIDIKMGTLSKTLASSGGFVAGRDEMVTFLRHHARGYIFSGALPVPQASVAMAALDVLEREPELVSTLWKNVQHYLSGLESLGFDTAGSVTPIVPVLTRNDELTIEMTRLCRADGLLVIPVCYPAVPADAPRLRTCVSAIHTHGDVEFALDVLARAGKRTGLIG
jgi:glycine C-acetyltransferase